METALDIAKRIKAISGIGLLYTTNDYDKERYRELNAISEIMMSNELKVSHDEVKSFCPECVDYPTPKVDIRAMVLNKDKRILMVQEKADNRWSLPGGWADIGQTPSEVAVKEVHEETGLQVNCKYLSAVFDKRMHHHPPQPFYVYKMVFYCELDLHTEPPLKPAFDVLDVAWFAMDALPPLSTDRILESQVKAIYENIKHQNFITIFD